MENDFMDNDQPTLILKILQTIREDIGGVKQDIASFKAQTAKDNKIFQHNLSYLADGLVSLKNEVGEIHNEMAMLRMASEGHRERIEILEEAVKTPEK